MLVTLEEHHFGGDNMSRYLSGDKDAQGQERLKVEHLIGNPARLARLIDQVPFRYRYSSLCVGFHPNDRPSIYQMREVAEHTLDMLLAGMRPHRIACCVTRHVSQDGISDLHIIIPRVDLVTGRSFNPAPPGCYSWLQLLQLYWNLKNGWASPVDPRRARIYIPPAQSNCADSWRRKGHDQALESLQKLADWICERVEAGSIRSRKDVIATLRAAGRLKRVTKKTVVVRADGIGYPLSMGGLLFSERFNLETIRIRLNSIRSGEPILDTPDPEAAAEVWLKLEKIRETRTARHLTMMRPLAPAASRDKNRKVLPVDVARSLYGRELADDVLAQLND